MYEHRALTCQRVDVERAWFGDEIARGSSTKEGHYVGSPRHEDIHGSSEKNDELLHELIEAVMCSERILHVSTHEISLNLMILSGVRWACAFGALVVIVTKQGVG